MMDDKMKFGLQFIGLVYFFIAIVTFGHLLNNKAAHTRAKELAVFTSIVWPLYWSWELQRSQVGMCLYARIKVAQNINLHFDNETTSKEVTAAIKSVIYGKTK